VRRRDAVLAKGAALAAEIVVVCDHGITIMVFDQLVGLDLVLESLRCAASLAALGLLFGWLALAMGRRGPVAP
jgi:hypothetical protein